MSRMRTLIQMGNAPMGLGSVLVHTTGVDGARGGDRTEQHTSGDRNDRSTPSGCQHSTSLLAHLRLVVGRMPVVTLACLPVTRLLETAHVRATTP